MSEEPTGEKYSAYDVRNTTKLPDELLEAYEQDGEEHPELSNYESEKWADLVGGKVLKFLEDFKNDPKEYERMLDIVLRDTNERVGGYDVGSSAQRELLKKIFLLQKFPEQKE